MTTYCTYFDSQYLARGMAMLRSLCRWDLAAAIRVMALDDLCAQVVGEVFAGQVEVVRQAELLEADADLRAVREGRSRWAFYATHKPVFLQRTLLSRAPGGRVVFIDADTWFYSDPGVVWTEMGAASIGLSPHGFSEERVELAKYGTFNAGFLCFRVDENALRCLGDWRLDCLRWCDETSQADGRFMNQGYLNRWPERYAGVHVIRHPGYNLAPWNVNGRQLERLGEQVFVDGDPLVFYHFSQTHQDGRGNWYSLEDYFPRQRDMVVEAVYGPYARAVEEEQRLLLHRYGIAGSSSVRQVTIGPDAVRVYRAQAR